MSADGLRVAVIGCGGMGRGHLRAYRASGIAPVALVDIDSDQAERAAGEFGGTVYADYHRMLEAEHCDAVSVCTPPAFHTDPCLAALAAGAAVLCEKPMAVTNEDCERLVAAAGESGRPLAVGFCHRYQPHVQRLKELAAGGRLGTVLMFHNRFAGHLKNVERTWFSRPEIAGGGALFDTCVHSVDLFRHLTGDVTAVRALTATTATDLGPALEVEDTAVLTLRSQKGVLGVIEASWRNPPGDWTVTLYGTAGSATVNYTTNQLTVRNADGEESLEEVEDGSRVAGEVRDFLARVRGEPTPLLAMAADGAEATRILLAGYDSAREGD